MSDGGIYESNNSNGVGVISITAKERVPIYKEPSENSTIIGYVYRNEELRVYDYVIPDIYMTIRGDKMFPLCDKVAFVPSSLFNIPPSRSVRYIYYEAGKRIILFSDGTKKIVPEPDDIITVPNSGTFRRVGHDYEVKEYDNKPRVSGNPTPETCQMWDCKPNDFIPLSEDYQRLWFSLIRWASHGTMTDGQLLTAWADATAERKALTDNHGLSHNFADYILGLFLNNPKPLMQKCVLLGGSLVNVLFDSDENSVISCLDATQPAPTLEYLLEHPYLWGWATEITSNKLPNGTWVVSRWPNLKHFGGWGFPYLIIGKSNRNVVRRNRLISVSNGSSFRPYNP